MELSRRKTTQRKVLIGTEELVSWVKKYPVLYDPEHGNFKDNNVRDAVWEQIAMQTHEDGLELKRRWKNLKDTYRKHILATQDEVSGKNSCVVNWKWAKLMDQFKPYLPVTRSNHSASKNADNEEVDVQKTAAGESDSGEGSSNFEMKIEVYETSPQQQEEQQYEFVDASSSPQEEEQQEVYEQQELQQQVQQQQQHQEQQQQQQHQLHKQQQQPKKQQQQQQPTQEANYKNTSAKKPASPVQSCCGCLHKRKRCDLTPTETILMGYAQTIERFSLQRQATTKLKIAQIIMEQELLEISEADVDHVIVKLD